MKKYIVTLSLLSLLPGLAMSHTGAGEVAGLTYGFGHPLGGVDHLLAMVAVGLWAAQLGGRALWVVPCTFVAVMVLGGALALFAVSLPYIEQGVMVSVLIFGLLIAAAVRLPLLISAAIVGFFAMLHGHAHGTEMPATLGALSYTAGFVVTSALLHVTGMGMGLLMQCLNLHAATRIAGGTVALSGLYWAVS